MKAKQVGRLIELEERVSDICTSLVIVETDHFEIHYDEYRIEITAYTHEKTKVSEIMDVMRKYSKPQDHSETKDLTGPTGNLWTITLEIAL